MINFIFKTTIYLWLFYFVLYHHVMIPLLSAIIAFLGLCLSYCIFMLYPFLINSIKNVFLCPMGIFPDFMMLLFNFAVSFMLYFIPSTSYDAYIIHGESIPCLTIFVIVPSAVPV